MYVSSSILKRTAFCCSLLFFWEKGRERKKHWFLLFYLFLHSLVDWCTCPGWVSNPQPWRIGSMLKPTELPFLGPSRLLCCFVVFYLQLLNHGLTGFLLLTLLPLIIVIILYGAQFVSDLFVGVPSRRLLCPFDKISLVIQQDATGSPVIFSFQMGNHLFFLGSLISFSEGSSLETKIYVLDIPITFLPVLFLNLWGISNNYIKQSQMYNKSTNCEHMILSRFIF